MAKQFTRFFLRFCKFCIFYVQSDGVGLLFLTFFRRFVRMETGNDSIFLHNFADPRLKTLRKDRVYNLIWAILV